jgi:hypothetical protein
LAAGTAGSVWLPASADEPLVAKSVCEAQELKARLAKNPDLAVQIPPEFDKAYPSLDACRSHAAAWNESAPGPNQPIPFSPHQGQFGMTASTPSGTSLARRRRAVGGAVHGLPPQFPPSTASSGHQIRSALGREKTLEWVQIPGP